VTIKACIYSYKIKTNSNKAFDGELSFCWFEDALAFEPVQSGTNSNSPYLVLVDSREILNSDLLNGIL